MSTDQLTPRRAAHGNTKLVEYDAYIDTQVESTRRMVKIVDLATSCVMLATGIVAYLLVVAVVEHWLVPGGFPVAVRGLLLALLAGGAGYFAYRRILPVAVGKINPVYAAKTIEESGPSLKNSLVNLLLFRQRREEISDAVYRTIEEQAARGLTSVPVDTVVDRSLLIRFGYVLLVVVGAAGLYKVLSPKDPLVAVQRVLMPWAEIVPASRVSIRDVSPGHVTVARGEFVDVSADVRGLDEDDAVLLRFTTSDGQAVDKPIAMNRSKDGLRFEGRLPERPDGTGTIGVTDDLRYRIEAGDARSLDYRVSVVMAPSILVERIDYDYPEYTGYLDRSVEQLGDIRAIEGTRVTIHARANGPIDEAHVDFNADGRRDLRMTSDQATARATFELALRDDRRTPKHASYVLRFTNREGRSNRDPVKHPIHVEPDRSPEVSILAPREREVQVRLDETITIEVDAIDPDFGLASVRLQGESAGRQVLDKPLLAASQRERFRARFEFTPEQHGLKAGDVMEYWASARDVKSPQPNRAESARKTLRVVSPDPQEPPQDRIAQRDPADGEQGEQGERRQGDKETGRQGDEQGEGAQPGGEQQQDGSQQEGDARPDGQQQGQGEQRQGEQRQGDKETGRQGDEQGEGAPQGGEQGEGEKETGRQGDKETGRQGDEETGGGGEQQGDGALSRDGGQQRDGAQSSGAAREDGAEGGEPSRVSSDGDHDAEAFERIQRHLEQSGELGDDAQPREEREHAGDRQQQPGEGEDRAGEGDKETGRQGDKETGRQGDKETGRQGDKETGRQGDEQDTGAREGGEQQPGGETRLGEEQRQGDGETGRQRDEQGEATPQDGLRQQPGEHRQGDEQGQGDEQRQGDTETRRQGERPGDGAPQDGAQGQDGAQQESRGKQERGEQQEGGEQPEGGQQPGRGEEQRQGDKDTGRQGDKQGEGVSEGGEQQPGGEQGQGDKETGRQGDKETGRQGEETGRQGDQETGRGEPQGEGAEQRARDEQSQRRGGTATGEGGKPGPSTAEPSGVEGLPPGADPANLEYARKQTDLVLETLSEQLEEKNVDDQLLKDLGWSEDDLRKFVERWRSRKEAAQRDDAAGEAARRELDEALRSLGLRRGPLRQGPVEDDQLRDLSEGYRGTVPLKYQDRLRAYSEGVSRSRSDGE